MGRRKHVVIVGGGFGGLKAARSLCREHVDLTVIDRRNHHLFQPLLYQVATAGLGPDEIATPIRTVLRRRDNCRVMLASVDAVELDEQWVALEDGTRVAYDYLVLAAGARPNYFGNDGWQKFAPSLKDLDSALGIRERVLLAFEAAERESDARRKRHLLTVVVIGGGPTGVELAGALSELGRLAMAREYQNITPSNISVLLVEMAPRLLPGGFAVELSDQAKIMLEEIGVEVRLGTRVEKVTPQGVRTSTGFISAANVIWASGVKPAALAGSLDLPTDRQGRVIVEADCSLPGHDRVFAIGDMAAFIPADTDTPLPALAPVAIQQGVFVARNIRRDMEGKARQRFRYRDKGLLATVGRSRAIAQFGNIRAAGLWAWWLWTLVHIYYLVGFRNRLFVLFDWFWRYLTHRPGARTITERCKPPITPTSADERTTDDGRRNHPLPPDLFP